LVASSKTVVIISSTIYDSYNYVVASSLPFSASAARAAIDSS
jgi:hypothetical protein